MSKPLACHVTAPDTPVSPVPLSVTVGVTASYATSYATSTTACPAPSNTFPSPYVAVPSPLSTTAGLIPNGSHVTLVPSLAPGVVKSKSFTGVYPSIALSYTSCAVIVNVILFPAVGVVTLGDTSNLLNTFGSTVNGVGFILDIPPLLTSIWFPTAAPVMTSMFPNRSLYTPFTNVIVVSPGPVPNGKSSYIVTVMSLIVTFPLNPVIRFSVASLASILTITPAPAIKFAGFGGSVGSTVNVK